MNAHARATMIESLNPVTLWLVKLRSGYYNETSNQKWNQTIKTKLFNEWNWKIYC